MLMENFPPPPIPNRAADQKHLWAAAEGRVVHSTAPTFLASPPELLRWAACKMCWLPGTGEKTGHRGVLRTILCGDK